MKKKRDTIIAPYLVGHPAPSWSPPLDSSGRPQNIHLHALLLITGAQNPWLVSLGADVQPVAAVLHQVLKHVLLGLIRRLRDEEGRCWRGHIVLVWNSGFQLHVYSFKVNWEGMCSAVAGHRCYPDDWGVICPSPSSSDDHLQLTGLLDPAAGLVTFCCLLHNLFSRRIYLNTKVIHLPSPAFW